MRTDSDRFRSQRRPAQNPRPLPGNRSALLLRRRRSQSNSGTARSNRQPRRACLGSSRRRGSRGSRGSIRIDLGRRTHRHRRQLWRRRTSLRANALTLRKPPAPAARPKYRSHRHWLFRSQFRRCAHHARPRRLRLLRHNPRRRARSRRSRHLDRRGRRALLRSEARPARAHDSRNLVS